MLLHLRGPAVIIFIHKPQHGVIGNLKIVMIVILVWGIAFLDSFFVCFAKSNWPNVQQSKLSICLQGFTAGIFSVIHQNISSPANTHSRLTLLVQFQVQRNQFFHRWSPQPTIMQCCTISHLTWATTPSHTHTHTSCCLSTFSVSLLFSQQEKLMMLLLLTAAALIQHKKIYLSGGCWKSFWEI